jgi:hypothetical protein
MTQPAPNGRVIDELLLAATIPERDFAALLRRYRDTILPALSPDAPALMLLESQPHRIITRDERQDLLRFTFFDPDFDFKDYTSGRIFHEMGELRWEREQAGIQLVYTGPKAYQPALQATARIDLDDGRYRYKDRTYLLFGKRLNNRQDLDRPGARTFAEVRIPRLLHYPHLPALTGAERVQLIAREYLDAATAANVAYRFKGLARFWEQSETQERGKV